jgi:hypothetical protein
MTDPTARDLIQRLADAREAEQAFGPMPDARDSLLEEARAYLLQPEPDGPTDEELHDLWLELYRFHDGPTGGEVATIARAALERWGNHAPAPIPASERLPTEADCDAPASVAYGPSNEELLDAASQYGIDYVDINKASVLDNERSPIRSDELLIYARHVLVRWGNR